jgi:CheY-like chemotaxis protein
LARTVLLADDSVTAQNMGRRILMDAGYEVITVNNGSAALKKIHENPPDLIVLDVYMPGYGGLEVCQRLKESRETMKIPVLLTVGKMEPFKTDEAKRVRADAHIIKPFDAGELLAALTKLEDRIVPQAEKRERGGKGVGKKSRSRREDEVPAEVPPDWSEKIAYLAEVKKRHEESPSKDEPAEQLEMPVAQVETFVEQVEAFAQQAEAAASAKVDEQPSGASEVQTAVDSASGVEIAAAGEASETAAAAPSQEELQEESRSVEETQPAAAEAVVEPASITQQPATEEPPQEFAVTEAPPEVEEVANAALLPELAAQTAAIPETAPETIVEVVATPDTRTRTRWIAEGVAVSAEEASLALDREMQQAQMNTESVQVETVNVSAILNSVEDVSQPEERSGAAFAAAASANSGTVTQAAPTIADEETGSPVEVQPALPQEAEASVPSEAIAAWGNWQHIRDSVTGPQQTEAIAASVAQAAQASLATVTEPYASVPAEPAKQSEGPAPPALEAGVLASIVDSVLAELKPKLMEEIAKKLAK